MTNEDDKKLTYGRGPRLPNPKGEEDGLTNLERQVIAGLKSGMLNNPDAAEFVTALRQAEASGDAAETIYVTPTKQDETDTAK